MKNALPKLSLLAGISFIAISSGTANAQSCQTGYEDAVYFDSCVPSTGVSNYYDYGSNYGNSYYDYTPNYAPQQYGAYQVNSQIDCQCADCIGASGGAQAISSDISARLSYIETILAYIVNFLGIDTGTSGATPNNAPVVPQMSRQAGDCAGGT